MNIIFFFSNSVGIQIVFFACHWLAMSNSCYNPFIYALLSVSIFSSHVLLIRCNNQFWNYESGFLQKFWSTRTSFTSPACKYVVVFLPSKTIRLLKKFVVLELVVRSDEQDNYQIWSFHHLLMFILFSILGKLQQRVETTHIRNNML